jgi:hypothetical protein
MIVATENPVRPTTAKAAWNDSGDDLKDLIKERGGPGNRKVRISTVELKCYTSL